MAIADVAEYAHLSDADLEALGSELEAIRRDIEDSLGENDRAYIQRAIAFQRCLEVAARQATPYRTADLAGETSMSPRQYGPEVMAISPVDIGVPRRYETVLKSHIAGITPVLPRRYGPSVIDHRDGAWVVGEVEVQIGSRGVALIATPDASPLTGQPPALGPGEVRDIAIDVVVGGDLIEVGHPVEQHRVEDGAEQQPLRCLQTAFASALLFVLPVLLPIFFGPFWPQQVRSSSFGDRRRPWPTTPDGLRFSLNHQL